MSNNFAFGGINTSLILGASMKDVMIIGAGPGGATAGALLAQAGCQRLPDRQGDLSALPHR